MIIITITIPITITILNKGGDNWITGSLTSYDDDDHDSFKKQ